MLLRKIIGPVGTFGLAAVAALALAAPAQAATEDQTFATDCGTTATESHTDCPGESGVDGHELDGKKDRHKHDGKRDGDKDRKHDGKKDRDKKDHKKDRDKKKDDKKKDDKKMLPVTGPSTPFVAGGAVALLALGGGLYLLARQRRFRFTA